MLDDLIEWILLFLLSSYVLIIIGGIYYGCAHPCKRYSEDTHTQTTVVFVGKVPVPIMHQVHECLERE